MKVTGGTVHSGVSLSPTAIQQQITGFIYKSVYPNATYDVSRRTCKRVEKRQLMCKMWVFFFIVHAWFMSFEVVYFHASVPV